MWGIAAGRMALVVIHAQPARALDAAREDLQGPC